MFRFIKKWFKRPVIINFKFDTVPLKTGLGVLTTESILNAEQSKMVREAWSKFNSDYKVVVLANGISLQTLSDDDLRAIGLVRSEEFNNG